MGVLAGHNGWITSLQTGHPSKEGDDSNILISGSRDKSIIVWKLHNDNVDGLYGQPAKQLFGHNHFVSDLSLSQDNNFCISSSWDKTLRLWDLRTGETTRQFVGHTKEVFTVGFSPDNRQIISAGADKGIKLWNTLADCKFTSDAHNHTEWVSCVRYSPLLKTQSKATFDPYFASVGWDGKLKIWNTNFQIRATFKPHDGCVNTVAISPNSKYLATGGRDKQLQVWDVTDLREPIRTIEAGSTINQIQFNPKLQWVSAATENGIRVWDLGSDSEKPIADLTVEPRRKESQAKSKKGKSATCTSLVWNPTGKKLFGGFNDGLIRVWQVTSDGK